MGIWRPSGSKVGYLDVDWLGSADITATAVDPTQHATGRIFYPCEEDAARFKRSEKDGTPWFSDANYAKGLVSFAYFRRSGWFSSVARPVLERVAAFLGGMQLLDLYPGAAVEAGAVRHPVVVFSHGLAGNRSMYSIICSELASQGYVVMALEHSDGSASACKVAGDKGWQMYGWDGGLGPPEKQFAKTRHRVAEMASALKVLRALDAGKPLDGLALSDGADPAATFQGALDFSSVTAMGHSFGGATAAVTAAENPDFHCGVCLDPWWFPIPPDSPVLTGWRTRSPLLVMPSHDWALSGMASKSAVSVASGSGQSREEVILEAAAAPRKGNGAEGAGAGSLLLVVSGSSHNTFADPLALFSERLSWLVRKLRMKPRLDPILGIYLINATVLNFLSTHLPLKPEQRAMQSWRLGETHSVFDRIRERTEANRVTPSDRNPMTAASDFVVDQALRSNSAENRASRAGAKGKASQGNGDGENGGPEDFLTGIEVLEAAMPSAEPASGTHPHAPSRPISPVAGEAGEERQGPAAVAAAGGAVNGLAVGRGAEVLAVVGKWYSPRVEEGEKEQYAALLGSEHIFKCEVHT
ncbi:hypothetical protein N2152v2_004903 [Parachlorella kessleri]